MVSPANQIRPGMAGSDVHPPITSREARSGQSGRPDCSGRATEDTLRIVVPLMDGGELRFHAVHGRVEMQIRLGKGRVWQTTPVTAERAEHYAARLGEIAQHARAQRQAKGT